jgi:hypothetical protein
VLNLLKIIEINETKNMLRTSGVNGKGFGGFQPIITVEIKLDNLKDS